MSNEQMQKPEVSASFDTKIAYAITTIESLFPSDEDSAKAAVALQRWAAELDAHYKQKHGKGIQELSGFDETLEQWVESNLR